MFVTDAVGASCILRIFAVICAFTVKNGSISARKVAVSTDGKAFLGKIIVIDTWSRCTEMARLAR